MAFVTPTPDNIRASYPEFAEVGDDVIQEALDEAALKVDETWGEPEFNKGRKLYTAHVLTLDGRGTSLTAELITQYGGGIGRYKAGGHEIEFAKGGAVNAGGSAEDRLDATSYGQRFKSLRRQLFAGPRVYSYPGGYPGLPASG